MQLFYSKTLNKKSTTLTFEKDESRHIIRVLRKKEGDILTITNGKNILFTATITLASDKKCEVKIVNITTKPTKKYKLSVGIAPTKSNDRLEWFLEKATEIGIDEIYPILCEHSERKVIKRPRLEKVVLTAMKQSLQHHLPVVHELTAFKDFIAKESHTQKFIALCSESTKNTLQSLVDPEMDTCILIGPEGGFSEVEIQEALQANYIPVSLGNTRLRTETAAIVAVHTVQLKNQF